jgi:hypothetical protein
MVLGKSSAVLCDLELWLIGCCRNQEFRTVDSDDIDAGVLPNFSSPYTTIKSFTLDGSTPSPSNISMKDYCNALGKYLEENRGKCLAGLPHPNAVKVVFRQLSVHWSKFVRDFISTCADGVEHFLRLAVFHAAHEHTAGLLMREFIYSNNSDFTFLAKRSLLEAKVAELLWPFQESHPASYGSVSLYKQRDTEGAPRSWESMAEANFPPDSPSNMYDAAKVLGFAQDYYHVGGFQVSYQQVQGANQFPLECPGHVHQQCRHFRRGEMLTA